MREFLSMNPDWRFLPKDLEKRNFESIHERFYDAPEWMKAGNHGLSKVGYSDQEWEVVNLPHDFLQDNDFSPDAETTHGSLPPGIAWYRKTFSLPEEDDERRIQIEFDGIYRDSSIWVNGHFVGRHLSGYTSFSFDISELCNYGGNNAIAIRCDARLPELWSYEGGGIYRDVRMVKSSPLRVDWCGTYVQSAGSSLKIETTIRNDFENSVECEIRSKILDQNGNEHASISSLLTIEINDTATTTQTTEIPNCICWELENPYLYTLQTTISVGNKVTDEYSTLFGVRDIHFNPRKGFFLNGKSVKLRGICNHQDHAGVGTAIPDSLQEWRILKMKKMGANALRVAHNPPTPALLDICDRLGILVMDETRLTGSSPELLNQLEGLIRRDRNHPSVILWSIGNEEMVVQATSVGIKQLRRMQNIVHKLDPMRPATYSMNCDWLDASSKHDAAGFHLDVFGANYIYTADGVDESLYDQFHAKHPDWPLIASESGGSFATRGLYEAEHYDGKPLELNEFGHGGICWDTDYLKDVSSAYNNGMTPWGSSIDATWKHCADRDFLAGTFLWTGFDYRGETYPFEWPAVVTRFGLMDLCGFPKDAYYYYKAWWNPEPLLHLFPHWNWEGKEGQPIVVRAYTNCAEVELILNEKSLVRVTVETNGYFETQVNFKPGKLEAVGYDIHGQEILRTTNETTGVPAAIHLSANMNGTFICSAKIVDSQGRFIPTSNHTIHFSVQGAGKIIGVGNGNPTSHESPKANSITAFKGLCQVLVQDGNTTGTLQLRAEADGLESCVLELESSSGNSLPIVAGILNQVDSLDIDANPVDGIL